MRTSYRKDKGDLNGCSSVSSLYFGAITVNWTATRLAFQKVPRSLRKNQNCYANGLRASGDQRDLEILSENFFIKIGKHPGTFTRVVRLPAQERWLVIVEYSEAIQQAIKPAFTDHQNLLCVSPLRLKVSEAPWAFLLLGPSNLRVKFVFRSYFLVDREFSSLIENVFLLALTR